MFSTVKKLAILCIIACALNIAMTIGVVSFVYSLPMKLEFAHTFSVFTYMGTVSGVLLATSCALFSASQDVNVINDANFEQIAKINKRLDELEKKQNI